MLRRQHILRERREYNQWVGDETLEDYALRFTAKSARRWSALRVANTALGSMSFLALEAIGGSITMAYGFTNAVTAILVVGLLIFMASLPICLTAARHGVDVDLLTRGAGFGYIGSTITSLIYASFTFIFLGLEAIIVASMLLQFFAVPLWLGYIVTAVAVLPLVTRGFSAISRFQLWTQPVWLILNVVALAAAVIAHPQWLAGWAGFAGQGTGGFTLAAFGSCASVLLALISQTAEQVDYLRFMPPQDEDRPWSWRLAVIVGGPGWIVFDLFKLLAGSFLTYGALQLGHDPEMAVQPGTMYMIAFTDAVDSPVMALCLTTTFVVLSQLKINVTNAYAGSIAWSNFFSRLTHSHPGRIVWVVFNIAIALTLLEVGAFETIQRSLVVFSNVAASWVGALVGDLAINKPLGLSPAGIEFKRAHLYDINPVGVGAMTLGTVLATLGWWGLFGPDVAAMSTFIGLFTAFVAAPLIAYGTRGRYYLARKPRAAWRSGGLRQCTVCETSFEPEDMAYCPIYSGAICSLCCSLDARCGDGCKPQARLGAQVHAMAVVLLPAWALRAGMHRTGRFALVLLAFAAGAAVLLAGIGAQTEAAAPAVLVNVFVLLLPLAAVAAWLLVLAQESRAAAQRESLRQTSLLQAEIRAHRRTDALLQRQLARFDNEMAEARRQQLSMVPDVFPRPDAAHPVRVHAVMIPAFEVGGDLYDCFEAAPGMLCVAVGDVSGKGMPAALFMARTRSLLRGAALQHAAAHGRPPHPSELARVLNEELCKNNDGSMFVTLFLGFLDIRTGTLAFANAGHVRPLRLRADGSVLEVASPPEPPLGLRRRVVHADHATVLQAGESLVIFSDGLPEATDRAGRFYGAARVYRELSMLAGASAETITAEFARQVAAFADGEIAEDDVTIMAVCCGPAS